MVSTRLFRAEYQACGAPLPQEITISYMDLKCTRPERRTFLRANYHFDIDADAPVPPPQPLARLDDYRQVHLQSPLSTITNTITMQEPLCRQKSATLSDH